MLASSISSRLLVHTRNKKVLCRTKCYRSDLHSKERRPDWIPSGISSSFMKAKAIILFIYPICTEITEDTPHHHHCKVQKPPLCIPHWKHQQPSCHHSFHHRCPAMTNHNVLKTFNIPMSLKYWEKINQWNARLLTTMQHSNYFYQALCRNKFTIFRSPIRLLLNRLPQL